MLEVADELACDWHTVNDAVTTYGEALLEADRKRLNRTSAIGLDETAFVKANAASHTHYATTVADVENHQIIDILPTRDYAEVARWLDKQPRPWKQRIAFGALDMSRTYVAVYSVVLPKAAQVVDPFHVIALANRCLDAVRRRVQGERVRPPQQGQRPALSGPQGPCRGRGKARRRGRDGGACGHSSSSAIRTARWPLPIGSINRPSRAGTRSRKLAGHGSMSRRR